MTMCPRPSFTLSASPRRGRTDRKDICPTCRRRRRAKRARCRECYTCISRRRAKADPVSYCYYNLRKSAKRRGIVFTLTKEYFRRWAIRYDYLTLRGRGREGYVVDRKNDHKGYEPGNIQVLTGSENTRKENARRVAEKMLTRKGMHVDRKIMTWKATRK